MTNVVSIERARHRRASLFPPIIAQETIDAQEAARKRRALLAKTWGACRAVALTVIGLAALSYVVGI